jgi:hypothetical protein
MKISNTAKYGIHTFIHTVPRPPSPPPTSCKEKFENFRNIKNIDRQKERFYAIKL